MWLPSTPSYDDLRQRQRTADPALQPALAHLRAAAATCSAGPADAVTDKVATPHSPTREPRDYVSIGTYFWPNPATPDGIPYLHRDGELSPEFARYDRPRWDRAAAAMVLLARAAHVLDDPHLAAAAAHRVRHWFIAPATGMSPHLCFAQMVPGRETGRVAGIIDFSLNLPPVLDHLTLLADLPASPWSAADQQAMATWCAAFLTWLEEHPYGRAAQELHNNHAVYYDRLIICLALLLHQPARASAQLARSVARIGAQIAADGGMPHELGRTCSFSYSLMNLRGFLDLALLGRALGVELWSHTPASGGTLPAATKFLYRHACGSAAWPYAQIEPIDWRMLVPVLAKANALAGHDAYPLSGLAHRLPPGFSPANFALLEPLHPFGQERSPSAPTVPPSPAVEP